MNANDPVCKLFRHTLAAALVRRLGLTSRVVFNRHVGSPIAALAAPVARPSALSLAPPLSSRLGMGRNNSRQSSASIRLPSRSDGNATVLMYTNHAVSFALYPPDARLPQLISPS